MRPVPAALPTAVPPPLLSAAAPRTEPPTPHGATMEPSQTPTGPRTTLTAPVTCPDLPCPECARPRLLYPNVSGDRPGTSDGIGCTNTDCPAFGMDLPVWMATDRAITAGAPDPNPAGLPRPRADGLPIPWVTPVTAATGPLWKDLHAGRLARAQLRWLCQLCGDAAPYEACLITGPRGACLTSAPLHDGCARMAAALCPAPAKANARIVTATPAQIITRGHIAAELGMVQTWRVLP